MALGGILTSCGGPPTLAGSASTLTCCTNGWEPQPGALPPRYRAQRACSRRRLLPRWRLGTGDAVHRPGDPDRRCRVRSRQSRLGLRHRAVPARSAMVLAGTDHRRQVCPPVPASIGRLSAHRPHPHWRHRRQCRWPTGGHGGTGRSHCRLRRRAVRRSIERGAGRRGRVRAGRPGRPRLAVLTHRRQREPSRLRCGPRWRHRGPECGQPGLLRGPGCTAVPRGPRSRRHGGAAGAVGRTGRPVDRSTRRGPIDHRPWRRARAHPIRIPTDRPGHRDRERRHLVVLLLEVGPPG
jgi:hypothetical protein